MGIYSTRWWASNSMLGSPQIQMFPTVLTWGNVRPGSPLPRARISSRTAKLHSSCSINESRCCLLGTSTKHPESYWRWWICYTEHMRCRRWWRSSHSQQTRFEAWRIICPEIGQRRHHMANPINLPICAWKSSTIYKRQPVLDHQTLRRRCEQHQQSPYHTRHRPHHHEE